MLEHAGIRILSDPWFGGRVFQDGWDLYSPVTEGADSLVGVDYLWISHEHPDHFHIPTLRAIEPDRRSTMTVLFQQTIDRRVVEFCQGLGFGQIVELAPVWTPLGKGLDVYCASHTEGNSWIAFRTEDKALLNLNDCGMRNLKELSEVKKIVGELDMLMTQFSYANWQGNPDQPELRVSAAIDKLEMVAFQCQSLEPKQVVLFASQMYFCHEENFFMNDEVNLPSTAVSSISENTESKPIVLYNGESMDVGSQHATTASCERYEQDLQNVLASGPWQDSHTESVSISRLEHEVETFLGRLSKDAPWYLRYLLRPAKVFLWDYGHSFSLARTGIKRSEWKESECDVALHSESFLFCLEHRYGLDTLGVSGRMHKPVVGDYRNFYRYFRFGTIAMRGKPVGLRYIYKSVANAILVQLGRREN